MATLLMEPAGGCAPVGAPPATRAFGADRQTPSTDRRRLAELAHELKNPLTLIDARALLLERRLDRSEPVDAAAIQAGPARIRPGVRQLVEGHGGTIRIASSTAGAGREVSPRLPVSPLAVTR